MKTLRNALIAAVLGFGLGLGATATADRGSKCTVDCREQERECIEMCGEWGRKEEKKARCEADCRQDALTCGEGCDGKKDD